jgi:hypothetical protein
MVKISKDYIEGLKMGLKVAKTVAKKYGLSFQYPSVNKIIKEVLSK